MDILVCGVGGQGTILTSKLIAAAALEQNGNARTGETIGMSQRGGCVVSHVRTGNVKSPYIPRGNADLLLAFELCEGARNVPNLKPGANAVINTARISPVTVSLGVAEYDEDAMQDYISANSSAHFLDAGTAAIKCGSVKAVNVVMLGAALGLGLLDFSYDAIVKAIEAGVAPKYRDLNLRALELGAKLVK